MAVSYTHLELRQGQLDGGLHSVDIHRRQLGSRRGAGHGELVGKHELHQLRQDQMCIRDRISPAFESVMLLRARRDG